jgi:hypothetical protein
MGLYKPKPRNYEERYKNIKPGRMKGMKAGDGMITRAKGGADERQVHINDVQIPDLWHLAMWLKGSADMILETWYLAHDLKNHIRREIE